MMRSEGGGWLGLVFAGAVLAGAFLLFQVQPLICKFILPWFGGSPAVWTTCMLFFQSVLFAGYAYAHLASRGLSPRAQGGLHLLLLAAALACLPIAPAATWRPAAGGADPRWQILGLLTVCVGLPYALLASTGPLVQSWFARAYPGRSPYRLYALSNAGSLLALVSYPFVVEPRLDLASQAALWSWTFWVYAVLCGACAVWVWRSSRRRGAVASEVVDGPVDASPAPGLARRALWVLLPAAASLTLLAATNHVCDDVAPMPFLWVVPLSLYLLTFIVAFDHERWYRRGVWAGLAVAAVVGLTAFTLAPSSVRRHVHLPARLALEFGTLFVIAMVCHGELVRRKPGPRHLTEFYLSIAAGGAVGGVFVSLVAPRLFTTFAEWPLALGVGYLVAAAVLVGALRGRPARGLGAFAAAAGLALVAYGQADTETPRDAARNFYGVISVWDVDRGPSHTDRFRSMVNGGVAHGRQWLDPDRRREPVSYYGRDSALAAAIERLQARGPVRVGVVGLGVGTLAAYARPGDVVRFYEINPEAERMARAHFTYLSDCEGKVEVVPGDARLSLEREGPQGYDLLLLDAFSGHAIPTHLLTREALAIYLRHLRPGGVLAFNIRNQYIDLRPVLRKLGGHYGLAVTHVFREGHPDDLTLDTHYLFMTRDRGLASALATVPPPGAGPEPAVPLWTDAYNDLFSILRR